jgi:hypothetical protein
MDKMKTEQFVLKNSALFNRQALLPYVVLFVLHFTRERWHDNPFQLQNNFVIE